MYHDDHRMFCYRTELQGDMLVKRGISRTNTLITLIGIRKTELAGFRSPMELGPALDVLAASVADFDSIGDIGFTCGCDQWMVPKTCLAIVKLTSDQRLTDIQMHNKIAQWSYLGFWRDCPRQNSLAPGFPDILTSLRRHFVSSKPIKNRRAFSVTHHREARSQGVFVAGSQVSLTKFIRFTHFPGSLKPMLSRVLALTH